MQPPADVPLPESTGPTRRLFVGLMAGDPVRQAVLDWRGQWRWPRGAALASPVHLHLTLHFLGEVPEDRLPALRSALAQVPFSPLCLQLGQAQTWARGLVVLRPSPDAGLDRLQADTALAVQAVGLQASALPWKPHLTLARKAAGAVPPDAALSVAWPVAGFELVWSRLPPAVPRALYEVLGRWPPPHDGVGPGRRIHAPE